MLLVLRIIFGLFALVAFFFIGMIIGVLFNAKDKNADDFQKITTAYVVSTTGWAVFFTLWMISKGGI